MCKCNGKKAEVTFNHYMMEFTPCNQCKPDPQAAERKLQQLANRFYTTFPQLTEKDVSSI